jgi:hypothetical protein
MKIKFILILSVAFSLLRSQENSWQVKHTDQVWIGYFNTTILNGKWTVNTDVQYRTKEWMSHSSQALVRTGLNYKCNDKFNVSAGAAHFRFYVNDLVTKGEWRTWEEIGINDEFRKLKITHRFRLEQRFNQKTDKDHPINSYGFSWRFRYKLELQYPVLKLPKGRSVFFTAGNEIMINAGKEIVYNYFDQNRASLGLLIGFGRNFSLQPQYISIWQQEANGKIINRINVIRLNLIHRIKL